MKKSIGIFGAFLIMSFSLSAEVDNKASSISNETMETMELFCDAGWAAVDGYYQGGGSDGFKAAQIFAIACG